MKFHRSDDNRIVAADSPFPVTIFANEQVKTEKAAFEELSSLAHLTESLERHFLACPDAFSEEPVVSKVVVTPDFHKGTGIPIGTVLKTRSCLFPKAMGNDIGCGMALFVVNGVSPEDITERKKSLEGALRHIFWGGGRHIALNREQREALLESGISGLLSAPAGNGGIWHEVEQCREGLSTRGIIEKPVSRSSVFEAYCGEPASTFDAQIGSIGGGNHFVELQRVKHIADRRLAYASGISENSLLIMVHSGSLSIGSTAWAHIVKRLQKAYPQGLKKPWQDFYPLPDKDSEERREIGDIIGNALHFASVNRLMLGLMTLKTIAEVVKPTRGIHLIHEAHHNFIEESADGSFIHRKGACRAGEDEPVIIPGSMGSSSFLLQGLGSEEALFSACHGAGRAYSRGAAMRDHKEDFERFLQEFTVVTPVDLETVRPDIRQKKLDQLRQEAPFAYKSVTPAIETVSNAGIATPVVELFPLMTLKS